RLLRSAASIPAGGDGAGRRAVSTGGSMGNRAGRAVVGGRETDEAEFGSRAIGAGEAGPAGGATALRWGNSPGACDGAAFGCTDAAASAVGDLTAGGTVA